MTLFWRHILCILRGHQWRPTEMIDYVEGRGTVVVELDCDRCEHRVIMEFDAEEFTDPVPEGPWSTEKCLICARQILEGQTAWPTLWPTVVMCKKCGKRWEKML